MKEAVLQDLSTAQQLEISGGDVFDDTGGVIIGLAGGAGLAVGCTMSAPLIGLVLGVGFGVLIINSL